MTGPKPTVGIDVTLHGAEQVESKLKNIGTVGQAAATNVGKNFTALSNQLNALSAITMQWSTSGREAQEMARGLERALMQQGNMASATAAQIKQLSDAQAIMAGTAAQATKASQTAATAQERQIVAYEMYGRRVAAVQASTTLADAKMAATGVKAQEMRAVAAEMYSNRVSRAHDVANRAEAIRVTAAEAASAKLVAAQQRQVVAAEAYAAKVGRLQVAAAGMDAAKNTAALAANEAAVRKMALAQDQAIKMNTQFNQGLRDGAGAMKNLGEETSLAERMIMRMVLAFAAYKAISLSVTTFKDAAAFEMMGIAMNRVGLNAGYSASQMKAFEKAITGPMGVSMMGARNVLTQMAGAHLDLAKSAQLSRMAQDVGKASNINSTEAFQRMIQAIVSGQPRMLRTMHILVSFEQAYKEFAKQNNIVGRELTETEKITARLNKTLEYGANFVGTYEEAFRTAGSQLLSAQRYAENARVSIGSVFMPEISAGVMGYAWALRQMSENAGVAAGAIATLGTAIVLLGTRWAVSKIGFAALGAMALNPVTMGIVAVAAAVGVLVWQLDRAKRARDELNAGLKASTDEQLANTRAMTQAARDSLAAKSSASMSGTGPGRSWTADQEELRKYNDLLREIDREQQNRARAAANAKQLAADAAAEAQQQMSDAEAKAAAAQRIKDQRSLNLGVEGLDLEADRIIAKLNAEAVAERELAAARSEGAQAVERIRIANAGNIAAALYKEKIDELAKKALADGLALSTEQAALLAARIPQVRAAAEAQERLTIADERSAAAVKASAELYKTYVDAIAKPIVELKAQADALDRMSAARQRGDEATAGERVALAGEEAARKMLNAALSKGVDLYTALAGAITAMKLAEGVEAKTIVIEKIKAAAREAKSTTDRMWRGVQEGLANAIEDGFKDGLRSARGFIDALGKMLTKVFSEALAAGLVGRMRGQAGSFAGLAGMIGTTGPSLGAVGSGASNVANAAAGGTGALGFVSAHPVVAAIAVVGVTMLTMGSAARRAAADVREMTKALTATMDQLRFEAGLMTPYEKSVADVKAQYEAARKQVKDKAEREVDAISPWTTRWHKAKRTDEIWTEAQKALDEINRLEAIRLGQLGKEKDAINDVIKSSIGMVAGYRYQAAIFAASNARSAPASPNAPAPVGGGSTGGTGGGGGNGGEEGGDLTVVVQMADGAVLGNAVIRNFKARAQRQFGDTSRWSEIT